MSKEGIKLAAEAFSHLQRIRGELLELGGKATLKKAGSGNQDIRLGQMLEDGKDAMKDTFAKITMEE
tara:strand:+ start:286 stop:486 length:201 start_codon:yes stop_codon:yes gene_type:complete